MNGIDEKLLKLADEIADHILKITDEKERVHELHLSVQNTFEKIIQDGTPPDEAEEICEFLFSLVTAKVKPHEPAIDAFVDEMSASLQMIDPKHRPVYIGHAIESIMPIAKHELGGLILRLTTRLARTDEIKGLH